MYAKLLKWCKDSEIILVARLQYIVGILVVVLDTALPIVSSNLSALVENPRTYAAVSIVNGLAMELLRRYRATDLV